jgi:heme-degrading monooxygenase HmoA
VSIIQFATPEDQRAWARDVEHRVAQGEGRTSFYDEYRIVVAEVTSDRSWSRR